MAVSAVNLLTVASAIVNVAAAERLPAALAICWAQLQRAVRLPMAVCSRAIQDLHKHMHMRMHTDIY